MISSILFIAALGVGIYFFYNSIKRSRIHINLGKEIDRSEKASSRWKKMLLVAIGQSKMTRRPIAGVLHIIVYIGFLIVNIEMLEIIIDGITGSHRALHFLPFYQVLISGIEVFAVLVILACVIFLIRRNIIKVKRFEKPEMTAWPRLDANIILVAEILLMSAFLSMNAADRVLQLREYANYISTDSFLISSYLMPLFSDWSGNAVFAFERSAWWFHILGILAFLNYIPYSKHFHVLLAFPNVFYSKLKPRAYINTMSSVTKEVKIAMGLESDEGGVVEEIASFGAKDVKDLSWVSLLNAYACTECGRCTDVCPANATGKLLSPRKIVMDTRDRLEVVGKDWMKNKTTEVQGSLLYDYISAEELWACTTCNACTEACPVEIDQVSIITDLRRYMYMEESAAPASINAANTNIENNGAPWQLPSDDRANWTEEIYLNGEKVEVPMMADLIAQGKKPEYLFWVGSAGSFDRRRKKTTADFVKLLHYLKVDYAILGVDGSDSGDLARRTGNEFTFQMQAMMNIEVLNGYEVEKIVTCNPHDFNVISNEYPDLGGSYQVEHHTQFIGRMIAEGKLNLGSALKGKKVTYHDPCYLGRGNGEYDAPRTILSALEVELREMPRNRSKSFCCGAGGGQMFKEAEKGDKEIFVERTQEALQTQPEIIATVCPFCMIMLTDGVKYENQEEKVKNYDLVELVVMAIEQ